jgi:hypothetical protein
VNDNRQSRDLTGRVDQIEAQVAELKVGQQAIFGKLDQIATSVTGMQANKPMSAMSALDFITRIVMIVGAVVSGIVYVARNGNNDDMHKLQSQLEQHTQRLERLDRAMNWTPRLTQ